MVLELPAQTMETATPMPKNALQSADGFVASCRPDRGRRRALAERPRRSAASIASRCRRRGHGDASSRAHKAPAVASARARWDTTKRGVAAIRDRSARDLAGVVGRSDGRSEPDLGIGDSRAWSECIAPDRRANRTAGRKSLIATYGDAAGIAIVNKLYVATLRRAVSIPSSLIEALAADDDDGDLANGTPNECAIRDAFGRHGLRTATGVIAAPAILDDNARSTSVRVALSDLSVRCRSDEIEGVTLAWVPGITGQPTAGSIPLTDAGNASYYGQLPLPFDDAVYYSASIGFKDGSRLTLADNLADPFYTLYQGTTVALYCTSFDEDPFAAGWTHGARDGAASPWAWGPAVAGPSDPPAAFTGTAILGQNLGGSYEPKASSFVRLPVIDVGRWSDVRLQYRRWLGVEDSNFDKARITVDGQEAWINFTANKGDLSSVHHIDREWRFHDVSLSPHALGHAFHIGFDLTSDAGLHLGGWAIDDLCVVANVHSICGDGVVSLTEQCDDGRSNADRADTCRTYCKLPTCGDQIVDDGEACDRGIEGDATCTAACQSTELPSGGCCSAGGGAGSVGLGGLVMALLLRRNRRRRVTEP